MFKSEYQANIELAKTVPAYKNLHLDGAIARQALKNYHLNKGTGINGLLAKIVNFFK